MRENTSYSPYPHDFEFHSTLNGEDVLISGVRVGFEHYQHVFVYFADRDREIPLNGLTKNSRALILEDIDFQCIEWDEKDPDIHKPPGSDGNEYQQIWGRKTD